MPVPRGNTFSLRLRVPKRFRAIESRKEVWIALGTDSPSEARILEARARAQQFAEWEALAGPTGPETGASRLRRLKDLAAVRGFVYRPVDEVADGNLGELMNRVNAVQEVPNASSDLIAAVLGGVEGPQIKLSDLVAHVEGLEDTLTANRFKSVDQMRKWRNPRKRAVANLRAALAAAGRPDDIFAEEVTHEVARVHWNAWKRRIKNEKLSRDTAEKDYANMSSLLKAFWNSIDRQYPKPYSGLSHVDRFAEQNQKPEFSVEWIEANIAAPDAMDGLNPEARDITLIIAETGCRQSEVFNTPPEDWHLDAPIPYFEVKPIEEGSSKREIKNRHSKRMVPLVGIALDAARRNPEGFPRYRGTSTYSDTVNKYFRERELFPSKRHTVGGLRHSWESRMIAIGLNNEERGEIMGHSMKQIRGREVYGDAKVLHVRQMVALLVGIGPLVEGEARKEMAGRLRKLLDEIAKERMD